MWLLAESLDELASATSSTMKLVIISSVAVSLGSRLLNRITWSDSRKAPAMITRPSTSSALTRIDPRIAVCATTSSPALSANRTTKNSGRFPSVACSSPVAPGPNRWPSCSVANDTSQATAASASAAMMNAATCEMPPAKWATAAAAVSTTTTAGPRPFDTFDSAQRSLPASQDGVVVRVGRRAAAQQDQLLGARVEQLVRGPGWDHDAVACAHFGLAVRRAASCPARRRSSTAPRSWGGSARLWCRPARRSPRPGSGCAPWSRPARPAHGSSSRPR